MKNKTIILAYSGGLDTSFCLKRLSSDGFDVHAILVNTGGFDKSELINIKKQAIELGASKFISIDVSPLSKGLYFIVTHHTKGSSIKKFNSL